MILMDSVTETYFCILCVYNSRYVRVHVCGDSDKERPCRVNKVRDDVMFVRCVLAWAL